LPVLIQEKWRLFIFYFFIFISYYCYTGGTLWYFQKCIQYILVKFTPSNILIFLPCFNWSHFSFSHIHPPTYCHLCALLSPCYQPPERTYFTFLSSIFEKRYFCLLKISIQGFSVWHFHVYMYCTPNWFICSIFLLSTLVHFLWWFQQV
jgi:hypothetical protein